MNSFLNEMVDATNFGLTENMAIKRVTTKSAVLDLFALGGAYRGRSNEDCIFAFKNALEEDESLAMKCLFYLRDCRGGGQGERRFFRVCFNWLAKEFPEVARRNLKYIPEYGRWDDIVYTLMYTPLEDEALNFIKKQLMLDVQCKTPSLLGKWLPSENCSSKQAKELANKIRQYLSCSHKQYRKMLSDLRGRIRVVEKLMSQNRWTDIEFDKLPSKAGIRYKNAFARRDILAKKYEAFAKDKNTKVNADTLFPYEIVRNAFDVFNKRLDDTDRLMVNKYWENQKDYLNGEPCKMLCVCDTSGSMTCAPTSARPIDIAISLSLYCAERVGDPFKGYYISFSRYPQLIKTDGVDFVDKVHRIFRTNLCENTDLVKTFRMLKDISLKAKPEDRLETIVVISDMEIDRMTTEGMSSDITMTEMEKMRKEWELAGLKMPRLVYWNVNARNNTILDAGPNVSFVSGASPSIFQSVLTGKSGWDLFMEAVGNNPRYEVIH